MKRPPKWLTEAEVKRLVEAAIEASKNVGCGEDELLRVIQWAEETRIDAAMLQLILEGDATISWPDHATEPTFHKRVPARAGGPPG